MRKILATSSVLIGLLFGGVGVANATPVPDAPSAPVATSTQAAENNANDNDNSGLWGLAGLLGLIGLIGLRRRNDADRGVTPGATTARGAAVPPRA